MHIRRVEIENIRSIKHLVWELPEEQNGAGWHVILGDNGSGKTSFVRSIAVACIDYETPTLSSFFILDLKRNSTNTAFIEIEVKSNNQYDWQYFPGDDKITTNKVKFSDDINNEDPQKILNNTNYGPWYLEGAPRDGWFISSFGSGRGICGKKIDDSGLNDRIQMHRHASIFTEPYSINNFESWLKDLQFKIYEKNEDSHKILSHVLEFINGSNLLPRGIVIKKVSSDGLIFSDYESENLKMESLSEGYKVMISLSLELVRQLVECFDFSKIFDPNDMKKIIVPGVVQIDEVDAHLHPSWQRRIGQWFKEHFPNMQFIVTTHSPLICWAADSVFVLPTPGTDETGRFLTEEELNRVKYGSIQEAYMLDAFGEIGRSEEGQKKLVRLTELNNKEWDEELTEADKKELQELRAALPLSALRMKE